MDILLTGNPAMAMPLRLILLQESGGQGVVGGRVGDWRTRHAELVVSDVVSVLSQLFLSLTAILRIASS
jgi:phage gp16-like protein